jgi:hypothetical protein
VSVAEGLAGGLHEGGAGAGLAGVVEAGAAVVGAAAGDQAEAVPAFDALRVGVEFGGGLVEGEHAGGAEPLPQAGDLVAVAVGAQPVGGEGFAVAGGQPACGQRGGGLAVGVGGQQVVDGGGGLGGERAFLPGVQRYRQGEGVGLAAAEAGAGGDRLLAPEQGDVGDEQAQQAFAFPLRGGRVVPQGADVGGEGADARPVGLAAKPLG